MENKNKETKPGNGGPVMVPQAVDPEKVPVTQNTLMPATLNEKFKFAQILVKSGLIPKHFNTAEKAMVALQMGHELGLKPMMSLNNIYVVDQKPTLQASLMMAIITNHPEYCDYQEEYDNEGTPKLCRVTISRMKHGKIIEYSSMFSLEDARTANLLNKDNWKKYPKAMLTARAQAATARKAFPDILAGMYTPEELTDGASTGFDVIEPPRKAGNFEEFMKQIDDAKTDAELEAIPDLAAKYSWTEDQAKILYQRYQARKEEIAITKKPETPEPESSEDKKENNAPTSLEEYKKQLKKAHDTGIAKRKIEIMKAARTALGDQYPELTAYANSLVKKGA